jgi:hypothetical protein
LGWHFPQREEGEPENLFTQEAQGSEEAPWILTGLDYEFFLYAEEGEGELLLTAVEVRCGGQESPSSFSSAAGLVAMSDEAFIVAGPKLVPEGIGWGKITITWSTGDESLSGRVRVCVGGEYAGHYPAGSEEAIAHLEALLAKGGKSYCSRPPRFGGSSTTRDSGSTSKATTGWSTSRRTPA